MKLTEIVHSLGFTQSSNDPCLFLRKDRVVTTAGEQKIAKNFVLIYVEDIIIESKSIEACKKDTENLRSHFELSEMDNAHFFLGLKIDRNRIKKLVYFSRSIYRQEE